MLFCVTLFISSAFRLFLNDADRAVMDIALSDYGSLDEPQTAQLSSVLSTLGMYCQPNCNNVREVLLTAANSVLLDRAMPFVTLIRKGIPDVCRDTFWSLLTVQAIDYLFELKLPTPLKVSSLFKSEDDLTNEQVNCLYFLQQYVRCMDQEDLERFLCFVTGSSVMPDQISVSFNTLTGELRRPVAHTCGNLLELPSTYISYQDLKREFNAILNNHLSFHMTII